MDNPGDMPVVCTQCGQVVKAYVPVKTIPTDNFMEMIHFLVKENASLKTEIASLKTEIASLKTENASLKTEIASLKTENASLKTEIASLKTENASLKTENASLVSKVDALTKFIKEQYPDAPF